MIQNPLAWGNDNLCFDIHLNYKGRGTHDTKSYSLKVVSD